MRASERERGGVGRKGKRVKAAERLSEMDKLCFIPCAIKTAWAKLYLINLAEK